MVRLIKYIAYFLIGIVGLLILAVAVINLVPGEKYKSIISSSVKSVTGRDLEFVGDLDISLFSTFSFNASNVHFSNADWGSRLQMASVDDIKAEIALLPLLRGILDITLLVDGPDLLLETHSSGQRNWVFAELIEEGAEILTEAAGNVEEIQKSVSAAQENKGLPFRVRIGQVRIEGISITYLDGESGERFVLDDCRLNIDPVDNRQVMKFSGRYNDTPLNLSTVFDKADFFVDNLSAPVSFEGHFGNTELAGQGRVGPLTPSFDLDLSIKLNINSVADFSVLTGQDLPDIGHLAVSTRLISTNGKYAVSDLLATLADEIISAEVKASSADLTTMSGLQLEADVSTDQLTQLLDTVGYPLETSLPDTFTAKLVAEGSLDNLAVKIFKTSLQGHGVRIDGTAHVKNITTQEGVQADFVLAAESLEYFATIAGTELPALGPLQGTVNVRSTGNRPGSLNIKMDVNAADIIHADIAGQIEDPKNLKGIRGNVSLAVDSFDWLAGYLEKELPPLGSLKATAAIVSKDGTFAVSDMKAELGGDNLHARLSGSMGDMLNLKSVHAAADFDLSSLAVLSGVAQTELPSLGPLQGTAEIASIDESFALKEITIKLADKTAQADVRASVADLLQLTGINATINVSVDSLASLDELLQQELPESGPVELEARLTAAGGLEAPAKIDTLLKTDGVTARLTGSIAEPLVAQGLDLLLTVDADSWQQVGKLAGTEILSPVPLKLESRFSSSDNAFELNGLHLQSGKLDATGKAIYQIPSREGERPVVNADFHVGELDLRKIQKAREKAGEETESAQTPAQEDENVAGEKLFSSDPLPWESLRKADVDITVQVDSLQTLRLNLEKMNAAITLNNGLLSIKPMKAKVGNGTFAGTVLLDAGKLPAIFDVDVQLSNGTFRDFGGRVNFQVDLEGSGNSVAEIMAGLDGQIVFDVRGATLKKSLLTGFGSGLLSSLNPFATHKDTTELTCAIALFDIEDGIASADKTIAAQMPDVTWFGSGEVNLVTEEIDFGMHPKARKGLVGLGNLASLVHIGGTLANPKIGLDAADVAVKYGKYSAAVATGGLTLLADIVFSKIKANQDVCAAIMEDLADIQDADRQAEAGAEKRGVMKPGPPAAEKTEINRQGMSKEQSGRKTDKKTEKKVLRKKSLLDSTDDYL